MDPIISCLRSLKKIRWLYQLRSYAKLDSPKHHSPQLTLNIFKRTLEEALGSKKQRLQLASPAACQQCSSTHITVAGLELCIQCLPTTEPLAANLRKCSYQKLVLSFLILEYKFSWRLNKVTYPCTSVSVRGS